MKSADKYLQEALTDVRKKIEHYKEKSTYKPRKWPSLETITDPFEKLKVLEEMAKFSYTRYWRSIHKAEKALEHYKEQERRLFCAALSIKERK